MIAFCYGDFWVSVRTSSTSLKGSLYNKIRVTIAHRDKLECHNKGAHFLVSSDLPDEQLFHDTSSAEMQVSRDLSARIDVMKLMFPPKMLEVFGILTSQLQSKSQCRFPLTLSILGSNNIVCCLSGDQLFKVVDSRCCGPNGILALWAKVQPENSAMEFGEFLQLAEKGNRRNVDSLTNEIAESKGFYSGMPNDYPVFDLGKMENLRRDQVASEDLARAVLGFNTDQIMAKAKDLSLLEQAFPIYFVGSFVQLEFVRSELLLRSHAQLIRMNWLYISVNVAWYAEAEVFQDRCNCCFGSLFRLMNLL